jgi:hypothetical protein
MIDFPILDKNIPHSYESLHVMLKLIRGGFDPAPKQFQAGQFISHTSFSMLRPLTQLKESAVTLS